MGKPVVFITAPNGTVGTSLVSQLEKKGITVRGGFRPGRQWQGRGPITESVDFDLSDPSTYTKALDYVDIAVVIIPSVVNEESVVSDFVRAANDARVRHIVYVSVQGADSGAQLPLLSRHGHNEKDIIDSRLPYTIVRASQVLQSFASVNAWSLQGEGAFYVPWATESCAVVDARDIAAVITAICQDPSRHSERTYTVTGERSYTGAQLAEALGSALGKSIRYQAINDKAARHGMTGAGLPGPMVLDIESGNQAVRSGLCRDITDDVRNIIGDHPLSIESFVQDFPQYF